MTSPVERRPWPRLVRSLLLLSMLCLGIAIFLTVLDGHFGAKLVYSFSIGLCCAIVIDGGRNLVLHLRRRRGLPDNGRVGWVGLSALIVAGVLIGPLLGMTIGDALTGGRSVPLADWQSPATRITLAVTVVAIVVSVLISRANDRAAAEALRAESAQREAAEAQLRLLQSQLEPHMLFNTLANLRVLIGLEPARAQAMLDRLIAFLRSTLAASRTDAHALADEFARIGDYLALMQVRMGPRLQVQLDLPPALAACRVPPLLLQPLVENAIKHGLEPQVSGGRLVVMARQAGDRLLLTVQDDGLGLAAHRPPSATAVPGMGFGLTQVRERLAAAFGDRARLELLPAADGHGTLARVHLPMPQPEQKT